MANSGKKIQKVSKCFTGSTKKESDLVNTHAFNSLLFWRREGDENSKNLGRSGHQFFKILFGGERENT